MRILVLGAGGTGGYFGGRLIEAGRDVTFLVRPRREAQLRTDGLVVVSPLGDIRRPVPTVTAATAPYDLILFSAKAYDLDAAIAAIAPAVGPETLILPMLNGLAHLEALDRAFGPARVLGGVVHISATLDADGAVRHLNKLHRLIFGERDPASAERCAVVEGAFAGCAVDWRRSRDVLQDLWEKWVFLAALAAVTCAMRADMGTVVAARGGKALILGILDECRAVAAAEGRAPSDKFFAGTQRTLTEPGSPLVASMLRDIQRGGPTEGDHVIGDLVRRGVGRGLGVPLLTIADTHLQAYEIGRGRTAAAA